MSHTTNPSPVGDSEIIALYFARDERAITETDRRYGRLCMQTSLNILASAPDAEECVNDTYFKTWNSIPPTRPQSLCAYLLRIVRNLSLNRLRALRSARRDRDITVSLSELEDCMPIREEHSPALAEALDRFLGTLEADERRLFLGRYWFGLSVKALAREWGLSPGTAAQRLKRTREKLRAYLTEGGFTV